ncbi:MAG: helix-turn-helix transcriptional regulator [Actinomycetota bacterium]
MARIVDPERLWSPERLAEHLGVPVATLAKWRHFGTGPRYLKIGKHVRYRPADVLRWEDEQCVRLEEVGL